MVDTTDPSARLGAAFAAIADARMRDLPFVNAALRVEAVGFAPWGDYWLGVMVTPWFMNLVLTPGTAQASVPGPRGSKRLHHFPAGAYEFIAGDDPAIGPHESCSLFSPMLEFEDHATACEVARLCRAALLDPANAERPEASGEAAAPAEGTGPLTRFE